MRFFILGLLAGLMLPVTVSAGSDELALDRQEIIQLVRGKTTDCRKEKDQSMCFNYFARDGSIKRLMQEDGKRRDGAWFVDDQDRLCILWTKKLRPWCFFVYEQDDEIYHLVSKDKHIATIFTFEDGNTKGL